MKIEYIGPTLVRWPNFLICLCRWVGRVPGTWTYFQGSNQKNPQKLKMGPPRPPTRAWHIRSPRASLSLTLKNCMSKRTVDLAQQKACSSIQHFFTPTVCPVTSLSEARGSGRGVLEARTGNVHWTRLERVLNVGFRNLDTVQVQQILADLEVGRRPENRNDLGVMLQRLPPTPSPPSLGNETSAGLLNRRDGAQSRGAVCSFLPRV